MRKKKSVMYCVTALAAVLAAIGFSTCGADNRDEEAYGTDKALLNETHKYTAGFIFGFDEDDIGANLTSHVIQLKAGQRADRSVRVSIAGVDGSGYFRLDETGALTLAALPQTGRAQARSGGAPLYQRFPGAAEITLEFKKGDKVLPYNILIRMVEPGTEGARLAELEWASPLPFGYDMINRSYLVLDVYKDGILDPILDFGLLLCFGFISSYDTRAWPDVEHTIFVYNYTSDSQRNETRTVDFKVLGAAADTQFQIDVLFNPADAILKKYGTHLLTRARWTGNMTGETEFSHSEEDLIPIWELIPHNKLSGYFDEAVVRQKAAELKQEYERRMGLQNRP